MKRVLLPDGPSSIKKCPITSWRWLVEVIQTLSILAKNSIQDSEQHLSLMLMFGLLICTNGHVYNFRALLEPPLIGSPVYHPWHLNKLWSISLVIVNWWKHENTPQHASTHQTLWSLAGLWNEDVFSSSEHIFHALISALGQTGWRIQWSTFPWRFYLKDMVFSLSCAICCLKFQPFQPEGNRALIGHVFEGTLAPHGWTALGEPDKVGV